jgi:ERCC4-type nuclease
VNNETLPYGDYQICDDIIFERKSFSDWEGSVMDGRIFKQAAGLKENFKSPCFILEGGPKYGGSVHTRPKLTKAALHSSFQSDPYSLRQGLPPAYMDLLLPLSNLHLTLSTLDSFLNYSFCFVMT